LTPDSSQSLTNFKPVLQKFGKVQAKGERISLSKSVNTDKNENILVAKSKKESA